MVPLNMIVKLWGRDDKGLLLVHIGPESVSVIVCSLLSIVHDLSECLSPFTKSAVNAVPA